jgi:hypothetical protein
MTQGWGAHDSDSRIKRGGGGRGEEDEEDDTVVCHMRRRIPACHMRKRIPIGGKMR